MKIIGRNYIRYENKHGELDNESGPAFNVFDTDGSEYNEWWRNGMLLGVFKNGKLMKAIGNSFSTLKEVFVPKKYEGLESTLSVAELDKLELKNVAVNDYSKENRKNEEVTPSENRNFQPFGESFYQEVTPKVNDGYRSQFTESLKTELSIGGENNKVFEHRLADGRRHCNDGPALKNMNCEYMEWWDKGRLVATYENGILSKSVDGTFSGLKQADLKDKWKDHVDTLSLWDIEQCSFKPEVVQTRKLDQNQDFQSEKRNVSNRISSIRNNAFNHAPSTQNQLRNI